MLVVRRMQLPIDEWLPAIAEAAKRYRAVIVVAAPGAGKTTRVPPLFSASSRTIVLQPRRVAARSLTRRIAEENGWIVGEEVGWHIRFERQFSSRTSLLVATEGVLTARLRSDPLLSEFGTVILDEFHERSIHLDLGLALVREAWRARDDLTVVVMSATLDASPISRYLGECPIIDVPGLIHPLEVTHLELPEGEVARAVMARAEKNVLWFLPGAREIAETGRLISATVEREFDVVTLHGSQSPDEQERALRDDGRRKFILSTNVAETSLTVPGVTDVVDSGWQKVMRYDVSTGVDALVMERISRDSAEQRAGRAARLAPGRAVRLWDPRLLLRQHREAEIERVDLAEAALEIFANGADPMTFDWFEKPAAHRLEAAVNLLERLGAIHDRRITPRGRELQSLPLHPRLGTLFLEDGKSGRAATAAALLSEGGWSRVLDGRVSSASDLLVLIARAEGQPTTQKVVRELRPRSDPSSEESFLRAVLAAYPDRVAKRRGERGRYLLSSGTGALLGRESSVKEADMLVALELQSGATEAMIRMASSIEAEWLAPNRREVVTEERERGSREVERLLYDGILLRQRDLPQDANSMAQAHALRRMRELLAKEGATLQARMNFAGVDESIGDLATAYVNSAGEAPQSLMETLPWELRRRLDQEAPRTLRVPSGREIALEYRLDGSVVASVKLQELFGLGASPLLGRRQVPVTFELLAPNRRPVQTTSDLASFWKNTYPEVRKELRGRYPKHPWPDDPWSATPTARTKKGR